MANAKPIADQAAREAALDPRRSFIVQAPAGSGKTELLVRRYLALLPKVSKPEEIVAITFTIKAAAEMRKRVLEKIPNGPQIAHRLRIQTIDAFCAGLTRQMPVLSRFGAQPGVVEDAREHYREAAKRTIGELSPPMARLLLHLDNNVEMAQELIAAMLARRDQWLRKTGAAPTRSELEFSLRSERERLLVHARSLHPKASVEFAEAMLTQRGTWFKQNAEAQSLAHNEELRLALVRLRKLPPERYTDEQWQVLAATVELLPRAAAHLKLVFAERNETDFTEIAQGAVRALGTIDAPTDLLLALDTRIQHILVDEFQDTSYSQFQLITKLTSGWEPDDGRTLFLVGDPMQSIYRFREAEVALFLDAWQGGLGTVELQPLTLSTNFRSQRGLVDWFNASFPQILPREPDRGSGAVPYSPATPHPENPALAGAAATWHNVPDRAFESQRIVDLVQNAEGRTAILVRTREALADIVPALKQAGIRYRAIEIEQLGEKQVVQDLYALTRALTHLGDRIAWLSLLRAPWLGLSLETLLEIAGADRQKTIWELIKDNLFHERFTRVLAPAIANRSRGSLRDRVEGVWLALGGPACVEDRTDLEDAEIYLDELDKLEQSGAIHDPAALRESLERLYALPDVEATDDDLQIMTIHKAKGLEFDTVIVPGLDKGPGGGDPPLLLFKELVSGVRPHVKGGGASAPGGLLLAPIKATGSDKDPAYSYLRDLHAEAEDTEASRLLYVAATRAERRLHLLACVKCDDHGDPKPPPAHTLLARAWPVAEEFFSEAPALSAREVSEVVAIYSMNRLAADFRVPSLPEPARWTAPAEGRDEGEIEFSWVGETARHIGTVVHRWLQRIAEDALLGWTENRIEALRPQLTQDLQRRGLAWTDAAKASGLGIAALKKTLIDERGRWLLGVHTEAKNEYRVRSHILGATKSYVIDRVFKDDEGRVWVVDYKTSRHEGADLDSFLDRERTRYAAQLEGYARAISGSLVGLYFPMSSGWRQWEPSR
jgi:ATP-dependent helicase/nuclease subunit A